MVINPIVGVYIPIIRIPIKGGMTIPNKTRLLTMAHTMISHATILLSKPKGFNESAARSVVAEVHTGSCSFLGHPTRLTSCSSWLWGALQRSRREGIHHGCLGKHHGWNKDHSPNLRNESSKAANGGSHSLNLA